MILLLLWILYCVLHSVLATSSVKLFLGKVLGKLSRYYRLFYSLFATVTLIFVLYFQYSFISPVLINSIFIKYTALVALAMPGLIIMIISIIKYFKLLSGVRSLYQARPASGLKLNGIHNYVRHPLYLGTLLFTWGLFCIFPMLHNLIAVGVITLYVLIGITFEEKKLINEFGSEYADYMSQVPVLIPRLKGRTSTKKGQPFGHP
ncbi:MAG: isoprenylcysteine carboxylmethyltransferase family protein [Ginsengibacter sp.]